MFANEEFKKISLADLNIPIAEDVQIAVLEGLFIDFLTILSLDKYIHPILAIAELGAF